MRGAERTAGAAAPTGFWTRAGISAQVALVVLLAAAAAGLATWLSARPGLRLRFDLTAGGRNTLDPALSGVIEKLPRPAKVEVFFAPLDRPLTQVGFEAQRRMLHLLLVAQAQHPHKLEVIEHDLRDVVKSAPRLQALGVREANVVVVHTDEHHRAVLRLLQDIARIDPGNPAMQVPPRLEGFRGEEALGSALLRVSVERVPKIRFSTGHGERELYGTEPGDLGSLHTALAGDGFDAGWWDSREEPDIPSDVDVLAIVDPRQPFTEAEMESVRAFVRKGGRLFCVPSVVPAAYDGPGTVAELLRGYGIEPMAGFVASFVSDSLGRTSGDPSQSPHVTIGPEGMDPAHEVTEPLWRAKRTLTLPGTRAFRRGRALERGVVRDLLRSPKGTWLDLPGPRGLQDWSYQPGLEERGPFFVAMASVFSAEAPGDGGEAPGRRGSRVIAFGSPDALANIPLALNRDFALAAFNWLAAREERIVVQPRSEERTVLELRNTSALAVVQRVSVLALPGACALLGVLLAWRRRR